MDPTCGRYFSLFLYYNIFFYFYQVAAGVIKITVLKESPPIIFYNKICQKSNSVEKLSKEVFFARHSSFWTNPVRAKSEGESSKFWCGKSYMRALVPGAPDQSWYEKCGHMGSRRPRCRVGPVVSGFFCVFARP